LKERRVVRSFRASGMGGMGVIVVEFGFDDTGRVQIKAGKAQ
jgi:hypothetical protein